MCKYKKLKPNHWKIILFLQNKKTIFDLQEKGQNFNILTIKNRYTVKELSKELNMAKSHVSKYLKELEDLGLITIYKIKGKIEVIL